MAEDAVDLVAEGALEEGESVEWAEEPEPDSEPITNEQMEEEREAAQDDGFTDEEAWNTVVATEDDDIEGLGNDAVEVRAKITFESPNRKIERFYQYSFTKDNSY